MTDQEILIHCQNLAVLNNKAILQKKPEPQGVHSLYAVTSEMMERIGYHAIKGTFPDKLFAERSPNESKEEADYIKKNYKQYTLPVFVDYLSTITRPFGDGNWQIQYQEDIDTFKTAEQTFQSYVEKELPIYGSLENFIKFILPSLKSIDANGFIAVRPKDIDYVEGPEGPVVDSQQLYQPTIYYFDSKSVIEPNEDYYLFYSKEKTEIKHGGKKEKTGSVYEVYTKNAVYFIKQIGVKSENTFETVLFYQHNLNEFPVDQLKGIPHIAGETILWQSPFLYCVDLLDIVTMNSNWLQASINKCVFPIPVMFGSPCNFKDTDGHQCSDGMLVKDGVPVKTCPECGGQGLKSRLGPLKTFLLNPSTKFETGEIQSSQDPLKYVSPDVTTLEFLDTKIEKDTTKARSILHLRNKNSSTNTQKDVTATEVYDDAKGTTAFVMPIIQQIFSTYEFCLKFIGLQRYNDSFKKPNLTYPKTCDFKTPEDYLMDISNALENNMPPSFIQSILMQYINSFYGDNPMTTTIFKLVMAADRIFGLSQDEINLKLARGTVSKWEDILHTSILVFINEAMDEDKDFLKKPQDKQVETIKKMAMEIDDDINKETTSPIYNTPEEKENGGG